jgi:hypothetical protein
MDSFFSYETNVTYNYNNDFIINEAKNANINAFKKKTTEFVIELTNDFNAKSFNALFTNLNNEFFKLNDNKTNIYILKEKLFTYTLLPINKDKPHKIVVQYTT